uniref:Uncharacterized protein n=1 Tax=Arundo donax TaxID=35708 RepID=A0A0A8Y6L0_ARUDO
MLNMKHMKKILIHTSSSTTQSSVIFSCHEEKEDIVVFSLV